MSAPADAGARLIVGVDEAGLGPLLGPLALGYALLRVPRGGGSLWERLEDAVCDDPRRDRERLVVADSKRTFARNPRGRERLETTVLSFLGLVSGERTPESGSALVARAPARWRVPAPELARHPWYAALPERLPLWTDAGRLELRRERLRRALAAADVVLLEAGVRLVPAGELNRSYERTHNKGLAVWEHVSALLGHLWEVHGAAAPDVVVDRQGGRAHYAELLAEDFPDAELGVVCERDGRSTYTLAARGAAPRRMRITFAERAEQRAFGVALASCFAKYARELSMEAFNAYFCGLQPGLRPTAGYTSDGRRWLREAAPALERAGLRGDVLVRRR